MGKISQDKIREMVEKYKMKPTSCSKLAEEYGTTYSTVSKYLKLNGVELYRQSDLVRKYTIDESYFDIIDTEEKAYFLGLLYADGSNNVENTNFCISLQEEDKDILDKFLTQLKSNRPYYLIDYEEKRPNNKKALRLTFSSKQLSYRLRDIGMVQNKEFVIEFPSADVLPEHLQKHFIRGYYDGDGSFSVYEITRNNKPQYRYEASIVSTEMMCLKIKNIIETTFGMTAHVSTRHKERNNSTRTLKVCGKQMFKFLEWMYQDSTIYMKRKHDKFLFELNKLPEWPILNKVNQYG